ncbi:hypothetical protein SETIT_3G275100v2 [Setaria italica]|uniref:Uncharacterized protein n=1 Tax=Setaria italica TaxID=4555 RepID=A0A368QJR1_SETIT|nr:hypothetical protein SETIT_3G275100v2 [Setaria italica]
MSLSLVRTLVTTLLYMSLISPTYFVGTLCLSKAHHITFLGILSYAISKSMKIMCRKCSLSSRNTEKFPYSKIDSS